MRSSAAALPLPDRDARRAAGSRPGVTPIVTPAPAAGAERAGRASFVFLVLAVLSLGLVCLLVVNTALARNSFTVSELQRTNVELAERSQALQEDLARAASPAVLARSARELGMMPAGSVAYVRLADGTISGRATTARGGSIPLTPEQRIAAQLRAAEAKRKAEQRKAEKKARAEAAAAARAAEQARLKAQEARKKAAAERKAWQAKLAEQDKAGARAGGETVVAPPTGPITTQGQAL